MRNKLKEIRAEQNLTQCQMAERAGISRPAYTNIELGKKSPDGETIVKLVKATGYSASDIFFDLAVFNK